MTSVGPGRAFSSIGEVLDLLKDEFPDVTISKIRFLESQGLLAPERTPSGYRKFYDADIDKLRWILRQQRERFLPLRVIRERLSSEGGGPEGPAAGAAGDEREAAPEEAAPDEAALDESNPAPVADGAPGAESADRPRPEPRPRARLVSSAPVPSPSARSAGATGGPLTPELTSVSFTGEELGAAAGLTGDQLAELERYGLLTGRVMAGTSYYDADALVVARAAAAFARHGVEPRHLRMYRTSVEREAALFSQLVLPFVRQRQPDARQRANETLAELARLGEGLRGALLRSSLREAGGST